VSADFDPAAAGVGRLLAYAALPLALFVALASALASIPLPWILHWSWVPSLGVDLAFHVDGLAAQMLLLISGVGSLVFIYTAGYLAGTPEAGRVPILLSLFMLAMIGAVTADNLLLLFVFWEMTSVLSFLLIGFSHEQEASRKAAQQALLVTGGGGLFLLAGFLLLGEMAGTLSLQELIAAAPHLVDEPLLPVALSLVFVGAFTKSAQFPFHFWLPNAMAAPTPVSAYLHSATMVKLGIYLLARLDPAFGQLLFWDFVLVATGSITALWGALHALRERDLKRILAWSTVSSLGTLTMLVGLPGATAPLAVAAFLFSHALYKATLFFVVGNLDHGAGTRSIDQLSGMRRYMPWTAAAAALAAMSMAGLPLSMGFVAKDVITGAKAEADLLALASYAAVMVGAVSVAVAAVAAVHVFWGRDTCPRDADPHEAPWTMLLPPLALATLGLLFGVMPGTVDPLLAEAAGVMAPELGGLSVESAYDGGPVLGALALSLLFGGFVYAFWDRLHAAMERMDWIDAFGPAAWYQRNLLALGQLSAWHTRRLQHGLLDRYLLGLLVAIVAAALLALPFAAGLWLWPAAHGISAQILATGTISVAGALAALWVRDRFVLLLASGLVGYGCAGLFLFAGAPDLAFTQFAVETVFVVVAAAVLPGIRGEPALGHALPIPRRIEPAKLLVSIAFGGMLTLYLLLAAGQPFDAALGEFFGARSVAAANGRNVVNVIIVDFRALDTLGEIAVLAFALLAAAPLFKLARERSGKTP
jgi:multicomponent Na+:H+ antiporter subunit A